MGGLTLSEELMMGMGWEEAEDVEEREGGKTSWSVK